MIKKIIKQLDLESDVKLISPIDNIKLLLQNKKLYNIINNYNFTDPIEKYIYSLLYLDESIVMNLFNDNYFNNLLSNIYFIISNPFSIDTKVFDIIYKNRELINETPNIIINIYDIILNIKPYDLISSSIQKKLYLFYNYDIINRWYKSVISIKMGKSIYYKISKLSDDKKAIKWEKYNEIWTIYNNNCIILKKYLKKLLQFYKPLKINTVGCYNIGKKYYEYCLKSYLGCDINIIKLEKWAYKELDRLKEQMIFNIKLTDIKIKDTNNFQLILKKLFNHPLQKFNSKQELIDSYKKIIKKYENIFVNLLDFKQYEKSNLVIFDSAQLGGGYYYLNNFYLNINDWKTMRKYTTESLVLHETVPGHHTQVHTMLNKTNKYSLLFGYFGTSCTAFIEGWGLFSEQLGFEQTIWDKIGQIEFEILRTLRIIIDIDLHYYGKTPESMIKLMQNYLTMSKKSIENEIFRYVCLPGQAVAYKVGSQVFKKILEQNNIYNFFDPKAIELYKKIINDGPKPLTFICKDYKLNENDLF